MLQLKDLPPVFMLGRLLEQYYKNQNSLPYECRRAGEAWIRAMSLMHDQVLQTIRRRELAFRFREAAETLCLSIELLVETIMCSSDPDAELAAGYVALGSRVSTYVGSLGVPLVL